MKTPREILLDQHRPVEPKLDALRAAAMAAVGGRRKLVVPRSLAVFNWPSVWWRELILPNRRWWSGLATVWALLLVINVTQRDTVSSVTGQPVKSAPVMMSWQAQQRWMSELLADRAPAPEADRPRETAPRPRTEHGAKLCV